MKDYWKKEVGFDKCLINSPSNGGEKGRELFLQKGAPRTAAAFRRNCKFILQTALEEIGPKKFVQIFIEGGDVRSAYNALQECVTLSEADKRALIEQLVDLMVEQEHGLYAREYILRVTGSRRRKLLNLLTEYNLQNTDGLFNLAAQLTQEEQTLLYTRVIENVTGRVDEVTLDKSAELIKHPQLPDAYRRMLIDYLINNKAVEMIERVLRDVRVLPYGEIQYELTNDERNRLVNALPAYNWLRVALSKLHA